MGRLVEALATSPEKSLQPMARPIRIPPHQAYDLQDRQVVLDDVEVPAGISSAVLARWHAGASLWRWPRSSGRVAC